MASQRVARYIAVQQAKGLDPDPQQVARMLREDTQSQIDTRTASETLAPAVTPIAEERAEVIRKSNISNAPRENRKASFSPDVDATFIPQTATDADIGSLDIGTPDLGQTMGVSLGMPAATTMGMKGLTSAAFSAALTPSALMSPTEAALKGFAASVTAPISLALSLNSIIGSSISGAVIGENIGSMFGEEAAQEAANVMSGRATLESISPQGQNAFANAMVASEQSPTSILGHIANFVKGTPPTPITSTVTPHHTNQAISEAFGVGFEPGLGFHGLADEGRTASGLANPNIIEKGLEPIGISGGSERGSAIGRALGELIGNPENIGPNMIATGPNSNQGDPVGGNSGGTGSSGTGIGGGQGIGPGNY